ncbi:UNVERIFIED_CONTAM: hypothetical protein FKN15_042825 [Acipenser sinensis]
MALLYPALSGTGFLSYGIAVSCSQWHRIPELWHCCILLSVAQDLSGTGFLSYDMLYPALSGTGFLSYGIAVFCSQWHRIPELWHCCILLSIQLQLMTLWMIDFTEALYNFSCCFFFYITLFQSIQTSNGIHILVILHIQYKYAIYESFKDSNSSGQAVTQAVSALQLSWERVGGKPGFKDSNSSGQAVTQAVSALQLSWERVGGKPGFKDSNSSGQAVTQAVSAL